MNRPLNWVCLAGAFFVAATQVLAQGGGCVTDQSGKVVCGQPYASCASNQRGEILCTSPGGGMMPDQYGELLCGPGYCVREQRGDVLRQYLRGLADAGVSGSIPVDVVDEEPPTDPFEPWPDNRTPPLT